MFNELAVNHIPVFLIYINQTFPSCTSRAIKITQITRNSLNDHKDVFLFSFHKRDKIQYLQQIYICGIMQIEEGFICWEWNYNIACQCNYAKYRSAPHNNDNNDNNNILHVSVTHSLNLNLILCLLILPLSIYLGHNVCYWSNWFQVKDR